MNTIASTGQGSSSSTSSNRQNGGQCRDNACLQIDTKGSVHKYALRGGGGGGYKRQATSQVSSHVDAYSRSYPGRGPWEWGWGWWWSGWRCVKTSVWGSIKLQKLKIPFCTYTVMIVERYNSWADKPQFSSPPPVLLLLPPIDAIPIGGQWRCDLWWPLSLSLYSGDTHELNLPEAI